MCAADAANGKQSLLQCDCQAICRCTSRGLAQLQCTWRRASIIATCKVGPPSGPTLLCISCVFAKLQCDAGLFARANSVNTNNRLYPKRVLHREVQKFAAEQVKSQCALGELDHPSYSAPTFKHLNLANISHQILHLKWKGNAVWGWIEVCFQCQRMCKVGLLLRTSCMRSSVVDVDVWHKAYNIWRSLILTAFTVPVSMCACLMGFGTQDSATQLDSATQAQQAQLMAEVGIMLIA